MAEFLNLTPHCTFHVQPTFFLILKKIKSWLMWSPCCLCLCESPLSTFECLNQSLWNLVCISRHLSPSQWCTSKNPSHQSVSFTFIATNWLSKHIPAATTNSSGGIHIVSKGSRLLVLSRTSCFFNGIGLLFWNKSYTALLDPFLSWLVAAIFSSLCSLKTRDAWRVLFRPPQRWFLHWMVSTVQTVACFMVSLSLFHKVH
jgi:hypothetical protein